MPTHMELEFIAEELVVATKAVEDHRKALEEQYKKFRKDPNTILFASLTEHMVLYRRAHEKYKLVQSKLASFRHDMKKQEDDPNQ
jgi:hypothetical protein